jgi:hypothetical protein
MRFDFGFWIFDLGLRLQTHAAEGGQPETLNPESKTPSNQPDAKPAAKTPSAMRLNR